MSEGEKKFDLEEFIFRYKFWIGGFLLFLIMIGSGILIWRENYWKPGNEERIKKQEVRIKDLELKIAENENIGLSVEGKVENEKPIAAHDPALTNSAPVVPKTENSTVKEAAGSVVTGKININTADATALDSLPGIGPIYAKRIVDYRESKGAFKSIDDIKNVQGIGDKTFLKFRDKISI